MALFGLGQPHVTAWKEDPGHSSLQVQLGWGPRQLAGEGSLEEEVPKVGKVHEGPEVSCECPEQGSGDMPS